MQKDVIISVKGMQKYDNADPDTIELVTEGQLEKTDDGYTLTYMESQITGLGGTQTTFQVVGDRVTLMREGEVSSQMVFEEGRRHHSMYATPQGSLTVGINTLALMTELTERGGHLEIDYTIEIDHAIAGRNVFIIDIKEAKQSCGLTQ